MKIFGSELRDHPDSNDLGIYGSDQFWNKLSKKEIEVIEVHLAECKECWEIVRTSISSRFLDKLEPPTDWTENRCSDLTESRKKELFKKILQRVHGNKSLKENCSEAETEINAFTQEPPKVNSHSLIKKYKTIFWALVDSITTHKQLVSVLFALVFISTFIVANKYNSQSNATDTNVTKDVRTESGIEKDKSSTKNSRIGSKSIPNVWTGNNQQAGSDPEAISSFALNPNVTITATNIDKTKRESSKPKATKTVTNKYHQKLPSVPKNITPLLNPKPKAVDPSVPKIEEDQITQNTYDPSKNNSFSDNTRSGDSRHAVMMELAAKDQLKFYIIPPPNGNDAPSQDLYNRLVELSRKDNWPSTWLTISSLGRADIIQSFKLANKEGEVEVTMTLQHGLNNVFWKEVFKGTPDDIAIQFFNKFATELGAATIELKEKSN